MLSLGIEATAHTFGIGICDDEKIISNARDAYVPIKGGIHPIEAREHHESVKDAVLEKALDDAEISPSQIDYICADGAGTLIGDITETMAIKEVFNSNAKKIPVSAPKSMFGNLLGASGAVDLVATVLAMENGLIPPTINYKDPDPECDLDYCPNKARAKEIKRAMIISRGRG